ncbi:hypothetical protein IT575_06360 [bacterium]|nr:hypothetical protein [bacterium]
MISPQQAAQAFEEHYGRPASACACAPGRANLIGEHIDYAGGQCLPFALQYGVTVAIAPGTARLSRLQSADYPSLWHVCAADGGERFLRLAYHLQENIGLHRPYDIMVVSDLPAGMGLSSSAAYELALAGAMLACEQQPGGAAEAWRPPGPAALARACQLAEQKALGTRCGLLDQYASLCGRPGEVLLLDCRSLDYSYRPFPGGQLRILLIDSGEKRELGASGYNERRAELERAMQLAGLSMGDAASLLELSRARSAERVRQARARLTLLEPHGQAAVAEDEHEAISFAASMIEPELGPSPEAETEADATNAPEAPHWRELPAHELLRRSAALPAPLQARFSHVITEQTRTETFAADLLAADLPMLTLGISLSHASLGLNYEVSTPRIDALVRALAALPGSRGARIHGGGFGGCVLALFSADADLACLQSLVEDGLLEELRVLEVEPSAGALLWPAGSDFTAPGQPVLNFLADNDDLAEVKVLQP